MPLLVGKHSTRRLTEKDRKRQGTREAPTLDLYGATLEAWNDITCHAPSRRR